jgi:hypothetical protein
VAIIIASALGALGFSAALAIALGRVAASADESSERMLAESRAAAESAAFRRGYAGWARTQSILAREPSTAVRSSRSRMGARRPPIGSCTSRRPAVRSNRPGREARP